MQWHIQGYPYAVKIGERCPYCGEKSQSLVDIAAFDQRHDGNQGKPWFRAVTAFTKESLFRVKTRKHALRLIGGAERTDDDIRNWFLERAQRAKSLATCLAGLRESISTYGDNSSDRFFETLSEALEQLEEYGGSYSDYTDEVRTSLRRLCTAIKRLQAKESEIRGVVGRLENEIASSSSVHKDEIDEMLRDCGYPYTIEITGDYARQEAKVLLVPRGTGDRIETPPNRSLSYGEQNAIALIMFMFDVITTSKARVIVLDDPISSFDGDKRFTLLYRLFHNFEGEKKNLFGRTVLLLTHDYLVVSDIANVLSAHFKKVNVKYLETRANVLYLRSVSKEDIVPYSQMIIKRIESSGTKGEFFQLVYIRCLCEMNRKTKTDRKSSEGCAFQVISEIAHMRTRSDVVERYGWDGYDNPPYIIRTGENFIRRWIPDFDMLGMLDKVRDEKYLIELYKTRGITAYEKLQIIRVLIEGGRIKPPSAVITRYANETFHLAGDYLLQLDPVEFNPVPENISAFYEGVFNDYERMAGSNSTVTGDVLYGESCSSSAYGSVQAELLPASPLPSM